MPVTLKNMIPFPGETGVSPDTTIHLEIINNEGSIVLGSVVITVDGTIVFTAGAVVPPWAASVSPIAGGVWGVAIWGTSLWGEYSGYAFTFTPPVPYDLGHIAVVNVTYP